MKEKRQAKKQDRRIVIKNIFDDIRELRKGILTQKSSDESMSQMHLLAIISHHEKITINEIAKKMNITGSAVTQFVDNFVSEKWVERNEDIEDRRKMNITITNKGKEKLQQCEIYFIEKFEKLIVDVTDVELEVLSEVIKKINNKLV